MAKNEIMPAHVKACLLSEGVNFTKSFLSVYQEPYLFKRRAYGNSDEIGFEGMALPQELILMDQRLVCGVHARSQSPWSLDVDKDRFVLTLDNDTVGEVTFPKTPNFYDVSLGAGKVGKQVGTLYGGRSLGIFVYGSCALVDMKAACQYCSIEPNRARQTEFVEVVHPNDVYNLVKSALVLDGSIISQVMINGGNFRDRNKGFAHYIKICEAARKAIDDLGLSHNVELHLIVFPPENKMLVAELSDLKVCIAMNTEVYDESIFAKICPGKIDIGGHAEIYNTLDTAVKYLGEGNVFSIFVGGLEPLPSLQNGIDFMLARGVVPIVNVFHADPGTPLANHPVPTSKEIISIGKALQLSYSERAFARPFYENCGRNALDTEAYRKLF